MARTAAEQAWAKIVARAGGRKLSPWELLDLMKDEGLIEEEDGYYSLRESPGLTEDERAAKKREYTRQRVAAYRAQLRANGDSANGYRRFKQDLLDRDGDHCAYCGMLPKEEVIDHILPVSRGGRSIPANLVIACKTCNHTKYQKTPEEARMPLRPLDAQRNWQVIKVVMGQRDRLEPADWESVTAILNRSVLAVLPDRVQPVHPTEYSQYTAVQGVQPPSTASTAYGVQRVHSVTAISDFPRHNAENGQLNGGSPNGAYNVPVEEEEAFSSISNASSSSGGVGGVLAVLGTLDDFSPTRDDDADLAEMLRTFPTVDILAVTKDYASAKRTAPASVRRLRKWVAKEATTNQTRAPAKPTTTKRLPRKAVHDFS